MMRFACVKQIELIGEASNHISEELRTRFNDVEWHEIIALRNVLVHQYFGIIDNILWDSIQNDLPVLKAKIENILTQL